MAIKAQTLVIRLLPMILVALFSPAQGVIIPQVLSSFGLSLSHGGLLVAINQSAAVLTMLVTGWLVERYGPMAVLLASAGAMALSALLASLAPLYTLVVASLWATSIGASSTAAATNALMALTGERRAVYLGIMHSAYSLMSIGVPLLAAWVVARWSWHDYYRGFFGVAVVIGLVLWRAERARLTRAGAPAGEKAHGAAHLPASESAGKTGADLPAGWRRATPVYPVCLGVFFMAGAQAALGTWGYSYMLDVYQSPHALAAAAASLFWAGILIGRVSAIPLSARLAERALLVTGCVLCLLSLGAEWLLQREAVAMAALVVAGYGVSGAFQLGTSWAAALVPGRIGVASSLVMASASLGGLVLPAAAALVADQAGFASFRWLLLTGYLVSALAFIGAGNDLSAARARQAAGA